MPMNRRLFLSRSLLAAGGIVVYGCTSPTTTPTKTVNKILSIAWGIEPKQMHAIWVTENGGSSLSQSIFDSLVKIDNQGNVYPDLAEKWTASPDSKTWTFNLAKNIKWHDGQPFSSADVKYTVETVIKIKGPGANDYSTIDTIVTPDPNTVVFNLKVPNPRLLDNLTKPSSFYGAVMPQHLYDDGTDVVKNKYNFAPIGTGPFKFAEWVNGDHITLEANPDYFKGRPLLDKIVFRIVPQVPTALASLEAGEVGYMSPAPALSEVPRLQKTAGIKVELVNGATVMWMRFNERPEATNEPFRGPNRIKVRQAIAAALDKNDINQKVYLGLNKPADGIWSSVSWAYNPNSKAPAYNPTQAERMLDEAGYPRQANGTRFQMNLMVIQNWEGGAASVMCTVIKEHLKKIGIDVIVEELDTATSFSRRQTGKFDTFLASTAYGPDPGNSETWLKSTGSANFYGSKNDDVDRLFTQAAQISDKEQRKALYFQLQDALIKDGTNLTLIEEKTVYAYHDEWSGWGFQDGPTKSMELDFTKVRSSR